MPTAKQFPNFVISMKTLDFADSEELGMFSVFDGFGPKNGGFSRHRPSILGRFPMARAKFPPLAFPSSFYPMSILAIGPNP